MRSLSILFTNNTLSLRAGSELWVRDVCGALVRRGHHPVAFSLVTGAVAEELRAATVPVVSDLDNVGFTPDLIHGHHHLETLIAALHFPGVPIVNFCHGWLPWEEAPLRHPAIARYVAVDETCVERLTAEHGIARERVDVLFNFVDLRRFRPRAPLPARPLKALILSNNADDHGYAEVIREACKGSGISVDMAGVRAGHVVEHPEELLPAYDLVFAKARTALEALAVGCGVILADAAGAGPLVTERDFARLRAGNFGIRLLQTPHSVDWYRTQIDGYDALDAARVSSHVRETAGLDDSVDRLLEIYDRALAGPQRAVASEDAAARWSVDAQRAAGRHLSLVTQRFKRTYELERAVHAMSGDAAAARARHEEMALDDEGLRQRVHTLEHELAEAQTSQERFTLEREGLRRHVATLVSELAEAQTRQERSRLEREELQQAVAAYRALPSLRLADSVVRIPLLGPAARRVVRWLNRSALLRR